MSHNREGEGDKCFYSQDQRSKFSPLHCSEFTEDLLEEHEEEVEILEAETRNIFDWKTRTITLQNGEQLT